VLSVEQLHEARDAGAAFAVSPSVNPEVIDAAQRIGLPFIPGAATPTEIDRARLLGCDVIKIFPASVVGGPAFLRSVSAVFPEVRFVPTGGVTEENLADYLTVPAVLACGGTWLCAEPDQIERRARAAAAA
jgi:2-dehydro-3-deoxyphosphogluconate aldolase/(4S)-4-hydroxy-2-oxoglutarate aldolase